MDFYSAIGGVTALLVGLSTRSPIGASKLVTPWSLMAQGIAAGSLGYAIAAGVGLPVYKACTV